MAISSEQLHRIFRKTERELDRLSSEKHAQAVHGFRTSSRRLETLLEEIAPRRDRQGKKLLKLLNAIRRRAGKVRDLDVQLAALRSLKVPQEPRRKTSLMQNLLELRLKREAKLRKLLHKKDVRDIRKRLKQAYKAFETDGTREPLAIARQIVASAVAGGTSMDAEKLHRCRVAVKRARYAAELAGKSPAAAEFIADLRRMQDALGNWHDWQLLTETAKRRLGEVNQSSLVAVLHNVTRGKFRQAIKAVSGPETARNNVVATGPSDAKPTKQTLSVTHEAAA
ncbi:MAG TPA: CHAD domain-containing protein [Candidatus Binatia bacterium]|nr:CHAD domain-containing protein [Candidatus Binatia bacterium]